MERELWTDVDGFNGRYMVSNMGRVRNMRTNYVLQGTLQMKCGGYYYVSLYNPPRHKTQKVAPLVAHHFIGPKPPGMEVNHINNIRTDDRASNLEYLTHLDNIKHAQQYGFLSDQCGEHNHKHKYTTEIVVQILRMYYNEKKKPMDISKEIKIPVTTIRGIVYRQKWKHLDLNEVLK